MKKNFSICVIMLFCILGLSQLANAQGVVGSHSFGVELGFTKVTSGGDDTPYINGGINSTYVLSPNVSLVGAANYTTDALFSSFEATANARYFPSPYEKLKIFGEGGIGIYSVGIDIPLLYKDTKSYIGINLGTGALLNVSSKIDIIAKVKYHNPFASGDSKVNWISGTLGFNVGL